MIPRHEESCLGDRARHPDRPEISAGPAPPDLRFLPRGDRRRNFAPGAENSLHSRARLRIERVALPGVKCLRAASGRRLLRESCRSRHCRFQLDPGPTDAACARPNAAAHAASWSPPSGSTLLRSLLPGSPALVFSRGSIRCWAGGLRSFSASHLVESGGASLSQRQRCFGALRGSHWLAGAAGSDCDLPPNRAIPSL